MPTRVEPSAAATSTDGERGLPDGRRLHTSKTIFSQTDDEAARPPGAMHLDSYFRPTHARLEELRCTRITLDRLVGRLGSVKNDPRFPSFTEYVSRRAQHAQKVAEELGLCTSDFPPLVFEPGNVLDAVERLIEKLEAELARTKSNQMKEREIQICDAFVLGQCTNGVICPRSHDRASVRSWIVKWLRRNTFAIGTQGSPLMGSGSVRRTGTPGGPQSKSKSELPSAGVLTSAAHSLGVEAWAFVVDTLRSPEWTDTRPPVTTAVIRHAGKSAIAVLGPALSHDWIPTLTSLDLSKNRLGETHPRGVLKLAAALETNTTLLHLNLSHNALGLAGATAILKAVAGAAAGEHTSSSSPPPSGCRITALNLASNDVSSHDPAFPHFCAAVAAAVEHLEKLSLGGNAIGGDGARRLLRVITDRHPVVISPSPSPMNGRGLISIDAAAASLDGSGNFHRCPEEERSSSRGGLRYLDLSWNRLGDRGLSAIGDFILNSSIGRQLWFLDLSWNRAGTEGIAALCTALSQSTPKPSSPSGALAKTSSIDTAEKRDAAAELPPSAAPAVPLPASPKINSHCSLQVLKLQYNPAAGKKGALAVAQFLKSNASLTHVDLRWTGMGDEGVASLSETLINNKFILEMAITGNDIDPRIEDAFTSRMAKRRERGVPEGVISMVSCIW